MTKLNGCENAPGKLVLTFQYKCIYSFFLNVIKLVHLWKYWLVNNTGFAKICFQFFSYWKIFEYWKLITNSLNCIQKKLSLIFIALITVMFDYCINYTIWDQTDPLVWQDLLCLHGLCKGNKAILSVLDIDMIFNIEMVFLIDIV